MPLCTNCGTRVDGVKFCPNCGTKVAASEPEPPPPCPRNPPAPQRPSDMVSREQKEDMVGVTGAVRSYTANATPEERERKYGQQKWGLFETDYQRRKGITTEQSLQEIEDFCANGGEVCAPHPSAQPGDGPFGGKPARPYPGSPPTSPRHEDPYGYATGAGGSGLPPASSVQEDHILLPLTILLPHRQEEQTLDLAVVQVRITSANTRRQRLQNTDRDIAVLSKVRN